MTHVVLLLHGIRDFGGSWMQPAKRILESQGGEAVVVVPVRFGYYDVLSFLAPWDKTDRPYQTFLNAYQGAVETYTSGVRISVVAHSFGAFLIGKLFEDNQAARLHRVLLCGSVLKYDFRWHNVIDRFDDADIKLRDRVRNECGNKDMWPVFAMIANARYGDSGRHGFESGLYSTTVHYNGGHALFFEESHIRNSWSGYLIEGSLVLGNATAPSATWLERITTWPAVTFFLRYLLIVPLWLILYYWWVVILLAAALSAPYFVRSEVNGDAIDLANYLRDIDERFRDHDEPTFDRFKKREIGRYVTFDGAVVEVRATSNDEADWSIHLLPPNCESIKSGSHRVTVTFPTDKFPKGVDKSALEPSHGRHAVVRVTGKLIDFTLLPNVPQQRWTHAHGLKLEKMPDVTCSEPKGSD